MVLLRSRVGKSCFVAAMVALALPSQASAATSEAKISAEARKHFNAGVALLRDPDGARYEEAYREFKTAYAASPSWKILGNLGLAAMKLERDEEAIVAYEQYLAQAKDLDAEEREVIQRDLAVLTAQAVTLTLRSVPGDAQLGDARVPVQGEPVRNRYELKGGELKLRVRPGHHQFTASLDGKPNQTWEVDLEPGAQVEHTFDFDAKPVAAAEGATVASGPAAPAVAAAPHETPVGAWVALGVAGAFAVGAGVTGVITLNKKSDFDDRNDGYAPNEADELHSQVKTFGLVTDALIGAAVVSAGIGTYLLLSRPKADEGALELRVAPRVGLQRGGLALEGRF